MTTYLLAIDGGSQSTKVSVFDDHGAVHASGQASLRPYVLGPDGRAVHPDDDLWDSLVLACRAALSSFEGNPSDIVGIGLCSIRFCRVLMDADGRLSEPVLSWMDARVPLPMSRVDADVRTIASASGYLTMRLTSRRTDSSASYRGMWPIDPATWDWSTDPGEYERTGMPRRLLPDLVQPGELLGHVTAEAANETGLPVGCPVFATANDKAVEALGCGLVRSGTSLLSLGTYIAAMTLGDSPMSDDDRYWVNAAAIPHQYLYESVGIRRGMWTVSWLRELVSSAAGAPVDNAAAQEWLNAGAATIEPGCGGLFTIPDWLAPGHAPYRRGAILGLDGSHGPHHLYRSILEGIAMTMRGHIEAMESALGRPAPRLIVSGGGARSDLFMQIIADVMGRPVERPSIADAAGLGSAVCAAVGTGVYQDFPTAVAYMVRPGTTNAPNPSTHERYDVLTSIYSELIVFTDPMFESIAQRLERA